MLIGLIRSSYAGLFRLAIPTLLLLGNINGEAASRVALVIGNNDYATAPLTNAILDATSFAHTLESHGFEVLLRTNLDDKSFKTAIYEFRDRIEELGSDTTALFFYSGHGIQASDTNYLIPIGADVRSESDLDVDAISGNRVMAAIERSDGVKIVILDACRNNPFRGFVKSPKQGLAQMDAPTGTIIGYSTGPGKLAVDGAEGENGPYTRHLIGAISEPGKTIEEVFKETRKRVREETNGEQVPWVATSLIGDFYFSNPEPLVVAMPPVGTEPISAELEAILMAQAAAAAEKAAAETPDASRRAVYEALAAARQRAVYEALAAGDRTSPHSMEALLARARSWLTMQIQEKGNGLPDYFERMSAILDSDNPGRIAEPLLKGRLVGECKRKLATVPWLLQHRRTLGAQRHWRRMCYEIVSKDSIYFHCDECNPEQRSFIFYFEPQLELAADIFSYRAFRAQDITKVDRALAIGQLAQMYWFGRGVEQDKDIAWALLLQAGAYYPYGFDETLTRWVQTILVDAGERHIAVDGALGEETREAIFRFSGHTVTDGDALSKDVIFEIAQKHGSVGVYDPDKNI